jgi:hypothetical protein
MKILCSHCGTEMAGPKCYKLTESPIDLDTPFFCSMSCAEAFDPQTLTFNRLMALLAILPELTEEEKRQARQQLGWHLP